MTPSYLRNYINYRKFFCFNQIHSYHIVTRSPWPIVTALSLFSAVTNGVLYLHFYTKSLPFLLISLLLLLITLSFWFLDIFDESILGYHSVAVQQSIKSGFILFVISEIMFFFGFFWAFFYSSLSPTIQIGSVWPPVGLVVISPFHLPFLNTLILLVSGITLTYSHLCLINKKNIKSFLSLFITLILAIFFLTLQCKEYFYSDICLYDGIYGSVFYLLTGFHGFHVIVGFVFLFICFLRLFIGDYNIKENHIGFICAIWYWHFVDVVWLFLFFTLYLWSYKYHFTFYDILVYIFHLNYDRSTFWGKVAWMHSFWWVDHFFFDNSFNENILPLMLEAKMVVIHDAYF